MEADIRSGNKPRLLLDLAIIGVIISILTYIHYSKYHYSVDYHILLQFGYYIPVIYAAMRFGPLGGIGCGLVITLLFIPVMAHFETISPAAYYTQWVEVFLINGIGWLTGMLVNQQRKATLQYQLALQDQKELVKQLQKEGEQRKRLEEEIRQTERLTALGHLSAGLAHEIRNPLGIILLTAQLLKQERPDDSEIAEYSQVLRAEGERLNRMVTDFLNFARPKEPIRRPNPLGVILDEGISLIQPILRQRQIKLEKQTDNVDKINVNVDLDQMKQVVLNIMLNAVEAQIEGGKIRVEGIQFEGYLGFSVSDEGSGISPDVSPHLYDPFYTTKQKGTGLGLSIVHRILDQHGGRIIIRNLPIRGARVEILLPLADDQTKNPSHARV